MIFVQPALICSEAKRGPAYLQDLPNHRASSWNNRVPVSDDDDDDDDS